MPNMVDSLTAIDPSQEGQALSPQQLIARQAYDRMMSPQQFFQRQYTGFQGPAIADNSGLIGKTSLDSQNSALQMQGQGANAAQATMLRGKLGSSLDAAKDAAKDKAMGGMPHKSEAQIHSGISSQGSSDQPAFASAPAMGGMPNFLKSSPAAKPAPDSNMGEGSEMAQSSGASSHNPLSSMTDEHLNPPNKLGIRTFTDAGHDYANRLADQYNNMTGFFNQ